MNEEGVSGMIVGTSFGGIILVIVVSVSVGNIPHVFNLGEIITTWVWAPLYSMDYLAWMSNTIPISSDVHVA